ncbi:chemotaxis protein CheB [Pelagibius sp. CAU 1746]|uniref:chemotaxis protein CheB n=1 Tax=Pelagibius sp. CAU 1746 TaxID=3140370 RepID=UPI00325B5B95
MPGIRLKNKAKAAQPKPNRGETTQSCRAARPGDFPVVAVGASAGGLDACKKFLAALPADSGMAFILVQHLDPTHQSMMVELLAAHAPVKVQQATDGMQVEPNCVYTIPPGVYLALHNGALRISKPSERHGARLPFDFLLRSLAGDVGERGVCVVLSGMGADGSLGAKAVKEKDGLVIAQDPDEADFDGMPRSVIKTGIVDLVLPAAEIPAAIIRYDRRAIQIGEQGGFSASGDKPDWLHEIVELLRAKTSHDFRLYKPGTLQRRVERRMAMVPIEAGSMDRYLALLRSDARELDFLAKDLLIHVTSFFRDPEVFDVLADKVISDLVRHHSSDQPLRIWIAGCSTGEETYSLVMLFQEQIEAANRHIRLQVFASDIDSGAVATAREGVYPESIKAEVSPARLARFFTKEDHGYRVSPDMRATVVFTEQDVLADPPFSRLDLVSCRNLLIYLQPEAQAKVISLFHFALRDDGILLLGGSETIGEGDERFEVVSKAAPIYRHVAPSRPATGGFSLGAGDGVRAPLRVAAGRTAFRQAALAELCRKAVLENYAPAAVLINRKHECLYSLGPTDRYLQVAPGFPTNDLLAMVPERTRIKLRSAIQRASQDNQRVVVAGGKSDRTGPVESFSIAVQPIRTKGEELMLVCFLDRPRQEQAAEQPAAGKTPPRERALEQELEATTRELEDAIRSLEISGEEQRAVNEELLSVNEEYQSTNEELLTSKEELQSLNEELTALNSQLQEALEQQRSTSNDLQNVLYSTNMATLFLDTNLNIRFFTPATKSLFNIISSDIGRPLSDLNSPAFDWSVLADAETVLQNLVPVEKEVEVADSWYNRKILPYRTHDDGVEGVVIIFTDITERRRAARALEAAKQEADLANIAKSRFLAAASHDLRQPLQSLSLLQGILSKIVVDEKGQKLVALMGQTLGAMTGMLNTLLDINQIDAGIVQADVDDFMINDLLGRLKDEFTYHATAKGLSLKVMPCSLSIRSDRQLLEQILRNIISNAVKYTPQGRILLGCRRHAETLSIEVWDTGLGIPADKLEAVFDEYHQVDNAARERIRGLGLGLSIVRRLGALLDHRLRVRSQLGKGSVFAIEVMLSPSSAEARMERPRQDVSVGKGEGVFRRGNILVVEDDPEVCAMLDIVLKDEGYGVATAADGSGALDLVALKNHEPDLILADYNLPGEMTGLQVAAALQEQLGRRIPVIVLTGDVSTETLRAISLQDCVRLNKPTDPGELSRAIQDLLQGPHSERSTTAPGGAEPSGEAAGESGRPVIFVVDDNSQVRDGIGGLLEEHGHIVEAYADCEIFLKGYRPRREACLLIDASLPGMSGLELLQHLRNAGDRMPAIMITGKSDVAMAVDAMKAGASDFIEKPVDRDELLGAVGRALELSKTTAERAAWHEDAVSRIAGLTVRQREIMDLILAGHSSKSIAADLGISQRTVEHHRAEILKRTGAKSLPALARLAIAASGNDAEG